MEDRELITRHPIYRQHRDEMLALWEQIVSIESGTRIKRALTG